MAFVKNIVGGKPDLFSAREHPYAFDAAAGQGDINELRALLKEDPRLVFCKGFDGWMTIHKVAGDGKKEVVQFLLDNNADVNAKSDFDVTPLHRAALGNRIEVAKILIARKANINARNRDGRTPLQFVVDYLCYPEMVEMVKFLLSNGADIEARNNDGMTALHLAAQKNSAWAVELLLARNANVNAKDLAGKTPLHIAARYGRGRTAEMLLVAGADPRAEDGSGKTPAAYAGYVGWEEFVRRHTDIFCENCSLVFPVGDLTFAPDGAVLCKRCLRFLWPASPTPTAASTTYSCSMCHARFSVEDVYDAGGRIVCKTCYGAGGQTRVQGQADAQYGCIACHRTFPADQVYDNGGEFICMRCYESRAKAMYQP